jgi:hypothetical protein
MKKFIMLLMVLIGVVSARPSISETATSGRTGNGYQWLNFEVQGETVTTTNGLVWYAYDIAGFSAIGIEDLEGSAGNVTTINAMPIYSNGAEMTGEDVTITEGTDLTVFKSPNYKFTFENNHTGDTTVTFNFLIAD